MVNPALPEPDCTTNTKRNLDVDKIIHQPGESKVIRWGNYNGCCKPGEYDAELDAFVEILHAQATGVEDTDTSSSITLAASEGPLRQLGPVVPVSARYSSSWRCR